jgi:hypothetical protein
MVDVSQPAAINRTNTVVTQMVGMVYGMIWLRMPNLVPEAKVLGSTSVDGTPYYMDLKYIN